jgi:NAD(P)-dependent dehydrogenase (short-subunit alcohol dehydrogenase family)
MQVRGDPVSEDQYTQQDPAEQYGQQQGQPAQRQSAPGEQKMGPKPDHGEESYRGSDRLPGKQAGRGGVAVRCDVREEANCRDLVERTLSELGGVDILVNNAACQMSQDRATPPPRRPPQRGQADMRRRTSAICAASNPYRVNRRSGTRSR